MNISSIYGRIIKEGGIFMLEKEEVIFVTHNKGKIASASKQLNEINFKIFEYEFSFVTSYVFSLNETIMYIKTIRFLW